MDIHVVFGSSSSSCGQGAIPGCRMPPTVSQNEGTMTTTNAKRRLTSAIDRIAPRPKERPPRTIGGHLRRNRRQGRRRQSDKWPSWNDGSLEDVGLPVFSLPAATKQSDGTATVRHAVHCSGVVTYGGIVNTDNQDVGVVGLRILVTRCPEEGAGSVEAAGLRQRCQRVVIGVVQEGRGVSKAERRRSMRGTLDRYSLVDHVCRKAGGRQER